MKRALIVVDVQNDFCEGGTLAVPDANSVVPYINSLIDSDNYDEIVLSQDFHPQNHVSFADNHPNANIGDVIELPDGTTQTMWPRHCVQNSNGAQFHPELYKPEEFKLIQKGLDPNVDSYSAFYDNNHAISTGLKDYLEDKEITHVEIVGLALDFCVKFTALDAQEAGFKTLLHYRGTKPVNLKSTDGNDTIIELIQHGVNIIS